MNLSSVDVLIVGAGPTGLTLAAALAKLVVKHRILDKNLERSDKSKAIGVQAGTLEALGDFFGETLAQKFIENGFKATSASLHLDDKAAVLIPLSEIPSKYSFILMLSQSENERLLEETLNSFSCKVDRGYTFLDALKTPLGYECKVKTPDGVTETIQTRFLVGCDGSHSKVREWAQIPFEGGIYTGDFLLADLEVDWSWEHQRIRAFLSDNGALACFPLKGEKQYRMIAVVSNPTLHLSPPSMQKELSLKEFEEIAQSLCPGPLMLSHPVWLTRFKVHHRIATNFRKENVFLAGDAAHIHSPIGGQGMNTGIQDALNLASKFHSVTTSHSSTEVLNDYESQRRPVARNILQATHWAFQIGVLSKSRLARLARVYLLPRLIRLKFFRKRALAAVSEVHVARAEMDIRHLETFGYHPSGRDSL